MKQTIYVIFAAGVFCLSNLFAADTKAAPAADAKASKEGASIGPKMVLEDWAWIERDASIQVAKDLDAKLPRFEKGLDVEWVTLGGVVEKGVYEWASSNYVVIVRNKADVRIPFEKLGYTERMRCDFNFRQEWVNLQSRIQTRTTLIENGVHLPGMPDPKARKRSTTLKAKPDPLENFEELFDAADPRAHTEMGLRFMSGQGVAQDPAYAVMYFREAASQGDVHAMYNLGVLYFKGIGIARNPNIALGLFTTASENRHPTAKSTLSKLKVSATKQREAQKKYAEEAAEYAKKASAVAHRYNRMLQSQQGLAQNRIEKRFDGTILRRTEVTSSNRNRTNNNRRRR